MLLIKWNIRVVVKCEAGYSQKVILLRIISRLLSFETKLVAVILIYTPRLQDARAVWIWGKPLFVTQSSGATRSPFWRSVVKIRSFSGENAQMDGLGSRIDVIPCKLCPVVRRSAAWYRRGQRTIIRIMSAKRSKFWKAILGRSDGSVSMVLTRSFLSYPEIRYVDVNVRHIIPCEFLTHQKDLDRQISSVRPSSREETRLRTLYLFPSN